MKPATPPLFGGVYPKTRDAIPPWRCHNHNLTTLLYFNSKIYLLFSFSKPNTASYP